MADGGYLPGLAHNAQDQKFMEDKGVVGDDAKVRDSIREAIRKLTDDKGADDEAHPAPSAHVRGKAKTARQKER